jgi:hypothetical protein
MFAVRSTYWSAITIFFSLLRWVWHFKYWLAHLLNRIIISWCHSCDMGINSSTSSHESSVPALPPFFTSTRCMPAFEFFYFPLTPVIVTCLTAGTLCAGEIKILLANLSCACGYKLNDRLTDICAGDEFTPSLFKLHASRSTFANSEVASSSRVQVMLASGWTDWAIFSSDKGPCGSLNNNQFAGVFLPQPALGGFTGIIIMSGFSTSGSSKHNHWSVFYPSFPSRKSRLHRLHCPLPPGPFLNTLIVTAICIIHTQVDPPGMLTVSPTSDRNVWTLTLAAVVRWIGRSFPSSIPMMPKPPSGLLPEELLNKAVTSSLPPLLLVPVVESWYRVTFVPSLLVLATSTSYSSYWLINKSSHEILPPINWTSNKDIITTFKGIDDAVRNLCSLQYYNNFHVLVVCEMGSPGSSVEREILIIWTRLVLVIMMMIISVIVLSAHFFVSCESCPLMIKNLMESDDLTPRQRCLDLHSPSARREMQQQQQQKKKKKKSGERRRAAVCRHRGLSLSLSLSLSLLAICTSSQPLAVPMLPSAAISLHLSRALTGTEGVY